MTVRALERATQASAGRGRHGADHADTSTAVVESGVGSPGPEHSPARFDAEFAHLPAYGPTTRVLDGDEARALLTTWLLQELAPALGLDPSKIEVRVDRTAAARTNASGASGLFEHGVIHLHPERYRPEEESGRRLLAHEAAHAAQAARPLASPIETAAARQQAEREAERAASAFGSRARVWRVTRPIDPARPAADTDFDAKLAQAVVTGRAREIDAIRQLLSGLWISDGDVFDVFKILDGMPFPVARAVVRALGRKGRYELCDNINTVHIKRNRTLVFACYDALDDDQFDAVDTSVLAEGPMDGLEGEERAAAVRTILHLGRSEQRRVRQSGNARHINALFASSGPRPETEADREARLRREASILADEQNLAIEREAIAAARKSEASKGIVAEVRTILDAGSSPYLNAQRAVDTLSNYQGVQLTAVAELLDADGLIDRIFNQLPDWAFFGERAHTDTLIGLMRSRLPSKNLDFVESLLSYGFLDWAVRDYEAHFAYRILKLLPLSAQYQFRRRDNGKWFMRLVQNLPEDFKKTSDYTGDIEVRKATAEEIEALQREGVTAVDPKERLVDVAALHQARRNDPKTGARFAARLDELKRLFADAEAADKPGPIYEDIHRKIAVTGTASIVEKRFTAADQMLLEIVVHDLDRDGYIDRLFNALSERFLYSEENRIATVRIMMARDPVRVQYHARELVSRGFTDWMVTDREAYLAYLCVKALPDDERQDFVEHDADAWGEILGEMSRDARQSADLNIYVGDKEGTDRGSVLAQLADRTNWTAQTAAKLDGLLHMAVAMTEHRFAFDRSEEFAAYRSSSADVRVLVAKYALYDPNAVPPRAKYVPNILKGTKWYEEGIFATLRTIWAGLVFLFDNDFLLFTRSAGAVNLDLNELQDVLGDIGGARLADPSRRFRNDAPNPGANKLTIKLDIGAHAAVVSLPELRIESVSMQAAGQTIQSGSLHLKGLEIVASYDSDDLQQPTHAQLTASSLELRDLLVSLRTSMIAVPRFFLSALRLGAGVTDTKTPGPTPRGGYYLPVPFLAQIAALIYYLFKLKGWGTDTPGTDMGRGISEIRALDVAFGSLEVDGFQTSGGQSVGKLKVTDFALSVGLNKTNAVRAQMASLQARKARALARSDTKTAAALQGDYDKAKTELDRLVKAEQRMLAIQRILLHEETSVEDERTLQKELDALALESTGGVYIDIGSIEASGVQGTVTAREPIKLNDIHGEGTSPAMAAGLGLQLLTPEKLRRIANGEQPKSLAEMGGDLRLELGDVRTGELSIGGGVRTVADIDAKLTELEPRKSSYEFAALYEHLTTLRAEAVRYEQYLAVDISRLNQEQLDDLRRLRDILAKEPDIVFGSIELIQAHLDLTPEGGIGIGAKEATIKNIRLPERGVRVDELRALDVDMKANARGGLAGWLDARRNMVGGSLTATSLTISGTRSEFAGLIADKITFTGREQGEKLGVQIEGGSRLTAGFTVQAEGLGVAPRIGLMKQRLDGLRRKNTTTPSGETARQIKELDTAIADLTALAETRARAWALVAKAKTPDEKQVAEQALMEAEGMIALGLKQYAASSVSLEGFGVQAEAGGDVLSQALTDGFDPMTLLEQGVSVKGTGPDNRLFRRFAVSGGQAAEDEPARSVSAGVGAFEVGETKVALSAKKTGDSIHVEVPQFDIASMTLSQFLFTSDEDGKGMQLWSTGQSSIEGISFKGAIRLDANTPGTRDLSDFRVAQVAIETFGVDRISASGLGYASLGEKLSVEIKSGTVNQITATGMTIDIPAGAGAPLAIRGKAGVGSIEDLDIGNAVVGAYEVTRGRVSARQMNVEFLEEGGLKASVGDLSLQSFALRGPDGWARFSLSHLAGRATLKDGGIDLEDVRLGSFEVSQIHWRLGPKSYIEADKPARIEGVRLEGRLETEQVPAKRSPGVAADPTATRTRLKHAKVSEFHVDAITGEHLVYQDEDNRVEIKRWDKSMPAHLKTFEPLFIRNVNVENLEWDADRGFVAGKADVEKYGIAAHYEGLKSGMKAGIGLRGTGVKAEVVGSGTFAGTLGKLDHIAGYYDDKKLSTKFATGAVVGNFAVGPDFVELAKVEVDGLFFGKTTYKDGTARSLELKRVMVDKIALGKVRQNFAKSTEPGKEGERVPTTLDVEDLVLTGIGAGAFTYDGKAEGTDADGKKTSSVQHVTATSAGIERLTVSKLSQNRATQEISASFKVDSAKSGLPAMHVHGLVAEMTSTIADKESVTKIATDVDGGPLTGDNITFGSVQLEGTTIGPDGKEVPVTRPTMKGKFQLDQLRLWSPNITIKETGKPDVVISKNEYGLPGHDSAKIELRGVKPEFFSNGTVYVPFDSVTAEALKVVRDGVTLRIPFAEIKDIAVGMTGMGTEEGLDWLGARLGQINVKGLAISMQVDRQKDMSDDEFAKALKEYQRVLDNPEPKDQLILEPLSGLSGEVEGEVSIGYYPDPDVTVKIQNSILQMSEASMYALYVRPDHIGLGNFGVHRLLSKDFDKPMPGLHAGGTSTWKSWPFDRGYINMRELIEGIYNQPPGAPSKKGTDLSFLKRLNFEEGSFKLGSGRAGLDRDHDQSLGDGDIWLDLQRTDESQNVIRMLESNIGEQLKLQMDTFRAGSAGFTAGKTKKGTERLGKTGPIILKGINVTVSGLAEFSFHINAYVREGTIEKVEIGDLRFVDKTKLAALPDPTLEQVNSKAKPLPAGAAK